MQSAYLRERRATASTVKQILLLFISPTTEIFAWGPTTHMYDYPGKYSHKGEKKRTGKGSSRNKEQESQVDTRALLMQTIWNEALKTSQEGWQFREAWVKREDKQWELPERHTAVRLEFNTLPNFQAFKALRLIWLLELTWSKGSQSIDTDNKKKK